MTEIEQAFDDAARARDEAGFVGTVADCIRFLDTEVTDLRAAMNAIIYELGRVGHTSGRTMRALNMAKQAVGQQ